MEEIYNSNRLINKYIFNTPDRYNIFLAHIRHMPVHMHDGIELLYVLKGNFRVKISFNSYLLEEGDFLLINPAEVHAIEALSDNNRVILMEIDESLFKSKFFAFDIFFYRNLKTTKVKEVKERMQALLHLDMQANHMSSPAKGAMLQEIINICEVDFQMHVYDVHFKRSNTYAEHPLNSERIRQVYEYLYAQGTGKKKLEELARIINIDKCYASRLIRASLGKPFQEVINIINADRAEVLLLGTDLSIQHISEALNFSSVNYFSKVFKQFFSLSPHAYRKAFKGKSHPGMPMDYEKIHTDAAPTDITAALAAVIHLPAILSANGNSFEKDGFKVFCQDFDQSLIIHSPEGKYKIKIEAIPS